MLPYPKPEPYGLEPSAEQTCIVVCQLRHSLADAKYRRGVRIFIDTLLLQLISYHSANFFCKTIKP